MTALVDGYWCEAVARSPRGGREWVLGGYRANTPRLAMRWLRGQAARLAGALDPLPGVGPTPPGCLRELAEDDPGPGRFFREWAEDHSYQETQVAALAAGRHVSVSAGGPDRVIGGSDTDVFYSLSARPIAIDVLSGWKSPSHHALSP